MEAKIEAFEMRSYRRIMRISWKEMKSNVEVLKMIGLKKYGTCFEYQEKETRKKNWPIMDMQDGIIPYRN